MLAPILIIETEQRARLAISTEIHTNIIQLCSSVRFHIAAHKRFSWQRYNLYKNWRLGQNQFKHIPHNQLKSQHYCISHQPVNHISHILV